MHELIQTGKSQVGTKHGEFWNCERIVSKGCLYSLVLSGRSDGKTYSFLKLILKEYVKTGKTGAIIRRYHEDLRGSKGRDVWSNLIKNGEIEKITGGEWETVYYYSEQWYLAKYVKNKAGDRKIVKAAEPFCYGFSLTESEHYKSIGYPTISTILFDEVISNHYLPDEFVQFMNLLSTIIRFRGDVRIFMIGNLINMYNCPYIDEMGLYHVKDMEPDDIDIYTYGVDDCKVTVAVELSMGVQGRTGKGKESDKFFAFDNPKMKQIISSEWEVPCYPHLPMKYRPHNVVYMFFMCYYGEIYQGDVVVVEDNVFIFIHRKTSELKDNQDDLIYMQDYSVRPNHRRGLKNPRSTIEKKILDMFKTSRVFYQDNTVGNAIANFIEWSRSC